MQFGHRLPLFVAGSRTLFIQSKRTASLYINLQKLSHVLNILNFQPQMAWKYIHITFHITIITLPPLLYYVAKYAISIL